MNLPWDRLEPTLEWIEERRRAEAAAVEAAGRGGG